MRRRHARALDRWRASLPDVVLLDLSLPGVDGLQVGPARAEGLQTQVLILTARGTVGDRVLGLNTGADDWPNVSTSTSWRRRVRYAWRDAAPCRRQHHRRASYATGCRSTT